MSTHVAGGGRRRSIAELPLPSPKKNRWRDLVEKTRGVSRLDCQIIQCYPPTQMNTKENVGWLENKSELILLRAIHTEMYSYARQCGLAGSLISLIEWLSIFLMGNSIMLCPRGCRSRVMFMDLVPVFLCCSVQGLVLFAFRREPLDPAPMWWSAKHSSSLLCGTSSPVFSSKLGAVGRKYKTWTCAFCSKLLKQNNPKILSTLLGNEITSFTYPCESTLLI